MRYRAATMSSFLAALLLAGTGPISAQIDLKSSSVGQTVSAMKPGEFLWASGIAPAGPVIIIVSLRDQRAYAYRNGVPIGISTVSTGKKGHATPTGVFTILQKRVDHKSNLYNNAPMPYMQRLTWDGIALHAGNLPGYPASHGCVRLPKEFARNLYGITELGLTVIITDEAAVPRLAPSSEPLAGDGEQRPRPETVEWHPERTASGPISIVISDADRRIVVLRNGIEIGSAPAEVEGGFKQAMAFVLSSIDNDQPHWLKIALPGQAGGGSALSAAERGRLRIPDDFRAQLAAILKPGTTVVFAPESLQSSETGEAVTVIADDDESKSIPAAPAQK